jgi:outer membrane cobalamin receptor
MNNHAELSMQFKRYGNPSLPVRPHHLPRAVSMGLRGLFLLSGPALVQAQAMSGSRGIDPTLEEVIVQGRSLESSLPLELSKYGIDLDILTVEQINNHGFVDVAQALEMLVPSLNIMTRHGAFSQADISLQGSRSGDMLWTVDGVRINNRLYNGTTPTDTLPSSMIERVEVLKGGQGLMYGTQAVAGVTNIVTRSFSSAPDGGFTVGSGSYGMRRANGYGRGALGDHKFVAWGSLDKSDGYETYDVYQPAIPEGSRDRGYDVKSGGIKYGYDFREDLSLTLMGIHTDAKVDHTTVAADPYNHRREDIASARLDYTPSDAAQFFLKSYYHVWDSDWHENGRSDYWGFDDFGASAAMLLRPHRAFEYHIGYDFQTYEGQDDVVLIRTDREDVHAVYAQIRSTDELFGNANFAAGVRHNRMAESDSTVGSVSGVYNFSDALYVQGVIGTSFLLPSAEQLFRIHCPNPASGNCTHGNPNLLPEESIGINASIGGLFNVGERALSWQLTGWDRRVDNLITTIPVDASTPPLPEGFTRTYVNVSDEVKMTGAEILLRGAITEALSFDVSYTHSKEINANGTRRLDRPARSHKASLSWSPPGAAYGFDVAYKYIGEQSIAVTGFGTQQIGDYSAINMGAHVFLDPAARNHRVTLRVENALDEDYATTAGSAVLTGSVPATRFLWFRVAPPRMVQVNYSYDF